MYLINVYLTGVHLTGVYLMGVYLINVHIMDVHLMSVPHGRAPHACISLALFALMIRHSVLLRCLGIIAGAYLRNLYLLCSLSLNLVYHNVAGSQTKCSTL
jgi:hypothetical protein